MTTQTLPCPTVGESTEPPTGSCTFTHPETRNPCIIPLTEHNPREDVHRAMGSVRMQLFGPALTCSAPPAGACENCGDDDPCEGYRLCSDCLEDPENASLTEPIA